MKKINSYFRILFLVVCSFFICSFSQVAHAIDINPYITFKLGYSHYIPTVFKDNTDRATAKKSDSALIGAAAGVSFQIIPVLGIRTELEYAYRTPTRPNIKVDNINYRSRIETQSVLANLYLDYYILPSLNIYLGAGIGLSAMNIDFPSVVHFARRHAFAAQGGLGIQYTLLKHIIFDLNVRYTYLGEWKYKNTDYTLKGSPSTIETVLSVGYKF